MPGERKAERIHKILANSGVASRRASEELIRKGRVALNGARAKPGDKAVPGVDLIEVDGIPVQPGDDLRYFVLNKPRGVITTTKDPQGRTTVVDLLPETEKRGARLFPVGRLDMESTGLILLTNDGFLANRLLHPSFEVPREYFLEVEPVPGDKALAMLRKGIDLEDGNTGPARVSMVSKRGQRAQLRMTIHTGRKRQIRRSLEHLGYTVVELSRVRIGKLGLGLLKPGETRELRAEEVRDLYRQTGIQS